MATRYTIAVYFNRRYSNDNIDIVFVTLDYFNRNILEGHRIASRRIANLSLMTGFNTGIISVESENIGDASGHIYYKDLKPKIINDFTFAKKVHDVIIGLSPKIVHILAFNKVFLPLLMRMRRSFKNTIVIPHLFYAPEAFSNPSYKATSLLIKMHFYDAIFTTTNSLKDYIINSLGYPPSKTFNIPIPVPSYLFKLDYESEDKDIYRLRSSLGIPANSFVVGYVGSITPQRGIFELLDIFKKVMRYEKDIFLLISHSNIIFKDLKKDYLTLLDWKITKSGLRPKVTIIGPYDLIKIFKAVDLLFFGFSESFYFTAPPLIVCEAMAAGVPFIFKKSQLLDFLNEIKNIPVYSTVEEAVELIMNLRYSAKYRHQLSKELKSYAWKNFSYKSVLKSLNKAYYSLLNQ